MALKRLRTSFPRALMPVPLVLLELSVDDVLEVDVESPVEGTA